MKQLLIVVYAYVLLTPIYITAYLLSRVEVTYNAINNHIKQRRQQ